MKNNVFIVSLSLLVAACAAPVQKENNEMNSVNDIHSFAEPNEAVVKHLDWDAVVDFETKIITAKASDD